MLVSIFALNIEIGSAYYRRNSTSFQKSQCFQGFQGFKRCSRFPIFRNYFKKHSRKASIFNGFKENKKFFQKVVDFLDPAC
jgi:hypothetical protein